MKLWTAANRLFRYKPTIDSFEMLIIIFIRTPSAEPMSFVLTHVSFQLNMQEREYGR